MLFKNILSPITGILSLPSQNNQGSSSSVNTVSTVNNNQIEDSTLTNNSSSSAYDGLLNGTAAGNGEQNYGVGVGNGEGVNFPIPFTTTFYSLGDSYSWFGNAEPVTSINTAPTSSSIHLQDQDTIDNSTAGNGNDGGFLNGTASGNGDHNYGIGDGNGDDANIITPVTTPVDSLGNAYAVIGDGAVESINTTPTSSTVVIEDNDNTNNSNTGVDAAGNGNSGGLLNGVAAGNGEHNYGIGDGNGDDASVTTPWTTPVQSVGNSISGIGGGNVDSINTATTVSSTHLQDNDTTNNSNNGTGTSGNGSGGGLANAVGAGNGEQNYGIGNGNGDDASVTTPVTAPFQSIGNSIAGIGGGDVDSVNSTPTVASNVIEDNDTTDNSNNGMGVEGSSGNGIDDGLLNGVSAGNDEHNYGIGNGNGDDADVTVPWTTPVQVLGNSFGGIGGGDVSSNNNGSTTSTNIVQDNDSIDNSNNSNGLGNAVGNGIDDWGNGPAAGNGEQNYGIGNGNGDDVDVTAPFTTPVNVLGNAFEGIGGDVSSTNNGSTTTLNHLQDNDSTDNSNNGGTGLGSASGNGIGGLLNGVSAGNGEHNYGIGDGNGDDAGVIMPTTTPINALGNEFSWFGDANNSSTNNASTTASNYVFDNDSTNNSNNGTGINSVAGNGVGGLLSGVGSGNGEHNYGIGNGNGDDASVVMPITTPMSGLGNSFALFGDANSSSVNDSSTTTVNHFEDNDTTNNSNSGTGIVEGAAGNGLGGWGNGPW